MRYRHKCGRGLGLIAIAPGAMAAGLIATLSPTAACAYVGDSFLNVPGVVGDWHGANHKHWVRVDANYWKSQEEGMYASMRRILRRSKQVFSGPAAPQHGASSLMISVNKHSPVLAELMKRCRNKTAMPELTYAESSER